MTIVFLTFFRNFAKLGGGENTSFIQIKAELKTEINTFLLNNPNKIWFTTASTTIKKDTTTGNANNYRVIKKPSISLNKDIVGVSKWFIGSDTIVNSFPIIEGTGKMISGDTAQMIIGYKEAAMMKREWVFKKAGDSINNFFGLWTVKIVWILWPTNTLLDEVHIINKRWFNTLAINNSLTLEETPFDGADLFYSYDQNNIPLKLNSLINSKKLSYKIEGKEYIAIYLWYDAAQEMRDEKEFNKIFDIIEEDGKEYIIAWIAKKTYTLLDMMHFVPKGK